jgi:hypothetical protein
MSQGDPHTGPRNAALEHVDHFPVIHCRHHHVEHDDVERGLQSQVQADHVIARQADRVTEFLPAVEQVVASLGPVFNDKDVYGRLPKKTVRHNGRETGCQCSPIIFG